MKLYRIVKTIKKTSTITTIGFNFVYYDLIILLKSYLTNRKQKCQIRNSFSSERLIKCGVPQGSILGPVLFLLYINDLPHCLSKTKPRLFADDTNLTVSANSMTDLEAAVNSYFENLRKWLIANKLSRNVAKTEFILIGSKSMIKIFPIHIRMFSLKINKLNKFMSVKLSG